MTTLILNTDGGARGNPGDAGCGAVLFDVEGRELACDRRWLGTATNNIAEYEAVLLGVALADRFAKEHRLTEVCLVLRMDSELVCKQLRGEYRVRDAKLVPLFVQVRTALTHFSTVVFEHVRREKNKRADTLANEAMDSRGRVL